MTEFTVSGVIGTLMLGILVYGRNVELFRELISFLAVVSIGMWSIVLLSTFVRYSVQYLQKQTFRKPRLDE